jgi:hypothetical protein
MGAVTQRFVVLVADRRITTSENGVVKNQDDLDTKTAFLDGRYVMGFAGLARLGPQSYRMEQWLVDVALAGYTGDDYFEHLADQTGKALEAANYGIRRDAPRAHSFLAGGYAPSGEGELVLVTNAHDLSGLPIYPQYPHSLNVVRLPLGDDHFRFAHIGSVTLSASERQYLYRQIRVKRARPTHVVGAMLSVLRGASRRSEGKIGTAAVVTIMPLGALPVTFNPTFLSWPGDDLLSSVVHASFAVPAEGNPHDGRGYSPAIWSRTGESSYGYRSLVTAAPPGSAQHEVLRTGDLSDFDAGTGGLASTMQGFPPSVLEGFPRHPLPPEDRDRG